MSPTLWVLCPLIGEGDNPHLESRSTSRTLFTSFSSGALGGTGQEWRGAGGSRALCQVFGRGRAWQGVVRGYSQWGQEDLEHRFHRLCQQHPGGGGRGGRSGLCVPSPRAWPGPGDPWKAPGRHQGRLPTATSPPCPRSRRGSQTPHPAPGSGWEPGLAALGHLTPHSNPTHSTFKPTSDPIHTGFTPQIHTPFTPQSHWHPHQIHTPCTSHSHPQFTPHAHPNCACSRCIHTTFKPHSHHSHTPFTPQSHQHPRQICTPCTSHSHPTNTPVMPVHAAFTPIHTPNSHLFHTRFTPMHTRSHPIHTEFTSW